MCELFGVSASRAPDAARWLRRFRARGGETADNDDGWGLASLQNGSFQLHKEPVTGATSALFAHLCAAVHSPLIIGHVRHARYPRVNSLDNTHPFLRTCCGRQWVFAHNGLVPEILREPDTRLKGLCSPQGQTDSEYAFCYLLEYVALHFEPHASGDRLLEFDNVAVAAGLIATHGTFNFLMSDGVSLIAYGHDRLHYLEASGADPRATVIATEPLTDDAWQAFRPSELRIYQAGNLMAQSQTRSEVGVSHAVT